MRQIAPEALRGPVAELDPESGLAAELLGHE
jgi:hypothetical protein